MLGQKQLLFTYANNYFVKSIFLKNILAKIVSHRNLQKLSRYLAWFAGAVFSNFCVKRFCQIHKSVCKVVFVTTNYALHFFFTSYHSKIYKKNNGIFKTSFFFLFCLQVKGEKVIVATIKCDLKRLSLIFNWCRDLWCQIFIIAHQSLGNVSTITPLPRNTRF